jgi:hypothetical protein
MKEIIKSMGIGNFIFLTFYALFGIIAVYVNIKIYKIRHSEKEAIINRISILEDKINKLNNEKNGGK